jgi:hypothetical protein
MTSETTEPKTPVQRIVSPLFREGDTVTVLCHDEGYVGQTGTILRVFKSGRCMVAIGPIAVLNLPPEAIVKV